jgi:hypothetical protein
MKLAIQKNPIKFQAEFLLDSCPKIAMEKREVNAGVNISQSTIFESSGIYTDSAKF